MKSRLLKILSALSTPIALLVLAFMIIRDILARRRRPAAKLLPGD